MNEYIEMMFAIYAEPIEKGLIKKLDTAIENLWNSLERGENTETITERINARTAKKEKLQIELDKELNKCTILSEAQILAFLDYIKNLPNDDINKKRAIINIFVNAVYLYDDHFDIVFNASNQMMEVKYIPIDDIETAFNGCSDAVHTGSSIKNSAPPIKIGTERCLFFYCREERFKKFRSVPSPLVSAKRVSNEHVVFQRLP